MKPAVPTFTPIIRQQPLPKLVVICSAGRRPLASVSSTSLLRERKLQVRPRAA